MAEFEQTVPRVKGVPGTKENGKGTGNYRLLNPGMWNPNKMELY